jgi:hypothetical protein
VVVVGIEQSVPFVRSIVMDGNGDAA